MGGPMWSPMPTPPPDPPSLRTTRTFRISMLVIGVLLACCSVAAALAIVFTGGIKPGPVAEDVQAAPASESPAAGGTLPDVTGLSPDEARGVLQNLGFTNVVVEPPATAQQPGQALVVAEQQPVAGTTAAYGDPIVLRVGVGAGVGTPPPGATGDPTGPPTTPTPPPASPAPTPGVPTPPGFSQQPGATTPPALILEGAADPRYATCEEANRAGKGPYVRGADPEYAWYLDRDGDGRVCEPT
ncbi:hypothetical protein HNP84_006186 [Thermocatellispora tengchongensis]|uniref:PASTA domain-containing protein n=2 Tax=Thermocatellispora tengchongensis TaxID=1073253 RepID=A0A840PBS4_9ACTN|nr:excalibur calcium-binding domain-containing protein [Thermocatellispora tengchongensis]MBB5136439.1 hypothetical protein [Thermocatellispora tengchongensis]